MHRRLQAAPFKVMCRSFLLQLCPSDMYCGACALLIRNREPPAAGRGGAAFGSNLGAIREGGLAMAHCGKRAAWVAKFQAERSECSKVRARRIELRHSLPIGLEGGEQLIKACKCREPEAFHFAALSSRCATSLVARVFPAIAFVTMCLLRASKMDWSAKAKGRAAALRLWADCASPC